MIVLLSCCNYFPQECLSVYSGGSDLTKKKQIRWSKLSMPWNWMVPWLSMYPWICAFYPTFFFVRSPVFMVIFTGCRSSRDRKWTTQLLWFILHFNILDNHEKHVRNYGHWDFHRSHWNLEELALIQPANHGPMTFPRSLQSQKVIRLRPCRYQNTSSAAVSKNLWTVRGEHPQNSQAIPGSASGCQGGSFGKAKWLSEKITGL